MITAQSTTTLEARLADLEAGLPYGGPDLEIEIADLIAEVERTGGAFFDASQLPDGPPESELPW